MLRSIVEAALRRRGTVIAAAVAVVVYGVLTAYDAKFDVLPEFAPPHVEIQTEAPGLGPEQVESLVTAPVEAALAGVGSLAAVRSESLAGLSVVSATFAEDADVFRARQVVSEALAEVGPRLPPGVHPPALSPLTSATMDVLKIGLTAELRSPMELRTFAEWTLRPRLQSVPGVARVNVFGGEVPELRVDVDAGALIARGIPFADVADAVRSAAEIRGLGFLDTPNQRILVDRAAWATTPGALAAALLPSGSDQPPLRLGDVALVSEAPAPRVGDALIQGRPGVLLTLSATYGSNTLEVTRELETALAEMAPVFAREQIALHAGLHRPASFIESALHNLGRALLIGAALVTLVLVIFLESPRAALVSLTAIPLSLLAAVVVLSKLGFALDTMVLGGLAIAIGEVVDYVVIDVANILRRLREPTAGAPGNPFALVLAASLEVRRTVVYATLGVALVFLPLLGLHSITGRFFFPLAAAYLTAVFASLLVALPRSRLRSVSSSSAAVRRRVATRRSSAG